MQVLIFGGGGFLGTRLVRELLEKGGLDLGKVSTLILYDKLFPQDFFDAAKVDGCGHLRFMVWIAAPLIKPTLITIALFAFLESYNALIWPMVVTGDEDMRMVQLGLAVFAGAEGVRINLLMCDHAPMFSHSS